jgi:aspartate kinase
MSDNESPPLSPDSVGSTLSSSGVQTPPNLYQNSADPSATWLVQKYGGTSVGKFAVKIAEDIIP